MRIYNRFTLKISPENSIGINYIKEFPLICSKWITLFLSYRIHRYFLKAQFSIVLKIPDANIDYFLGNNHLNYLINNLYVNFSSLGFYLYTWGHTTAFSYSIICLDIVNKWYSHVISLRFSSKAYTTLWGNLILIVPKVKYLSWL